MAWRAVPTVVCYIYSYSCGICCRVIRWKKEIWRWNWHIL